MGHARQQTSGVTPDASPFPHEGWLPAWAETALSEIAWAGSVELAEARG